MNVSSLKFASVFPSVLNDDVVIALNALQNCEVLFCTERVFEVYQSQPVLLRKLVANLDSPSDQSVLPTLLTTSTSWYVRVLRLSIRKHWVVGHLKTIFISGFASGHLYRNVFRLNWKNASNPSIFRVGPDGCVHCLGGACRALWHVARQTLVLRNF